MEEIRFIFNQNGSLKEFNDNKVKLVQSSSNVYRVVVVLLNQNLNDYTGLIEFKRPDGSVSGNLAMSVATTNYNGKDVSAYTITMPKWATEIDGELSLTCRILKYTIESGEQQETQLAYSLQKLVVYQSTSVEQPTTITDEEYQSLIETLNSKLNKVGGEASRLTASGLYVKDTISALNNVGVFGKITFVESAKLLTMFTPTDQYDVVNVKYIDDFKTRLENGNITVYSSVCDDSGNIIVEYYASKQELNEHNRDEKAHPSIQSKLNIIEINETANANDISSVNQDLQTYKTSNNYEIGKIYDKLSLLNSTQNLVDVLGTYNDLVNYDHSGIVDGDKIQVLSDEQHDNASTVYEYHLSDEAFPYTYVGKFGGDSYTRAESDEKYETKINAEAKYTELKNYTTSSCSDVYNKSVDYADTGDQQVKNYVDTKTANLDKTATDLETAFDNLTQAILDSNILGGE